MLGYDIINPKYSGGSVGSFDPIAGGFTSDNSHLGVITHVAGVKEAKPPPGPSIPGLATRSVGASRRPAPWLDWGQFQGTNELARR